MGSSHRDTESTWRGVWKRCHSDLLICGSLIIEASLYSSFCGQEQHQGYSRGLHVSSDWSGSFQMSDTLLKSFGMWLHFSFWHAKIPGFDPQYPIKIKIGKVVLEMITHTQNTTDCFVELPVTCPCFCFLGKALHVRVHTGRGKSFLVLFPVTVSLRICWWL